MVVVFDGCLHYSNAGYLYIHGDGEVAIQLPVFPHQLQLTEASFSFFFFFLLLLIPFFLLLAILSLGLSTSLKAHISIESTEAMYFIIGIRPLDCTLFMMSALMASLTDERESENLVLFVARVQRFNRRNNSTPSEEPTVKSWTRTRYVHTNRPLSEDTESLPFLTFIYNINRTFSTRTLKTLYKAFKLV